MQAAFGRGGLSATSFFTYVGLGLGFIASSLSLPFGVFVLVCQRKPEKYIQVSPRSYGFFGITSSVSVKCAWKVSGG